MRVLDFGILKRTPGGSLVFMGFTMVCLVAVSPLRSTSTTLSYLALGFGFVTAAFGIALVYREARATDAEAQPLAASTSDLEHAVGQLNRNYEVLRRQATQGFLLAGLVMVLGLLVVLAGAVGEMFGFTAQGANLTTIAGIVVEAISGLGLILFRQTFHRINEISDRLHDTWRVLAAFRKAEALSEARRDAVMEQLIVALAFSSPLIQKRTAVSDGGDVEQDLHGQPEP